MKILTKIMNRFNGSLIFEAEVDGETEPIRLGLAVRLAISAKTNLRSANLRSADLRSANLYAANLESANLYAADLESANLESANLESANLYAANLRSANLESANLYAANLRSANLRSAYLRSADLRSANLYAANLYAANLESANLESANLYEGCKLVGERPVFQIGPIGSRCAYLTVFLTNKGIHLRTGCFFGPIEKFREALESTHDGNVHGKEYAAALDLILKHAELWMPGEEPK